jgi:3',5'-cyclic-AMP phosphodiesterase
MTTTDSPQIVTPASDTVRVVQVTDTHLCREPGGKLLGMDTDHSLQAVLDIVSAQRSHIDILLGTGDLSDNGSREAYVRLHEALGGLPGESFWLPGNHDLRAHMEAVAGPGRLCGEIEAGNWQIVMLDSQIPGEVGGCLGAAELAHLENALRRAQSASLHSLLCLHHQPVPIGCDWLDQQMVADADAFWQLVDQYPGVRGVLWGHVHQQVDTFRGDVHLMASPSTCAQFKPGSADFAADDQPPGYRWLDLAADGSIETGVSRVTDVAFTVDLDSDGYL